jgi:hypothetical protein
MTATIPNTLHTVTWILRPNDLLRAPHDDLHLLPRNNLPLVARSSTPLSICDNRSPGSVSSAARRPAPVSALGRIAKLTSCSCDNLAKYGTPAVCFTLLISRVGEFDLWKFRLMYVDGDVILREHLKAPRGRH